MALIAASDIKTELGTSGTEWDTLLGVLANAVQSVFELKADCAIESAARTEYYDGGRDAIVLKHRPVASTPTPQVYEDSDWVWSAGDLLTINEDYRIDYESGIIYFESAVESGRQAIKVIYTAGYTSGTIPTGLKEVLVRQAAHWFLQAKNKEWAMSSVSLPGGAGTTSYADLEGNLLPDFIMMVNLFRAGKNR